MNLEIASYIAGIIAAAVGIGSLYYARAQHNYEKRKISNDKNDVESIKIDSIPAGAALEKEVEEPFKLEREGVPEDLLLALETTKGMFNKPARDSALKVLAEKAVARGHIEFAIAVVSEIWHKPTKDDQLTRLVKVSLSSKNALLAHRATELFFNKPKMDAAKSLIIEWVDHDKA